MRASPHPGWPGPQVIGSALAREESPMGTMQLRTSPSSQCAGWDFRPRTSVRFISFLDALAVAVHTALYDHSPSKYFFAWFRLRPSLDTHRLPSVTWRTASLRAAINQRELTRAPSST